MKVTEKIERKIKRMQEGTTFKYQQLGIDQSEYSATAKAIERLIKKGMIKRVSTGIFYKPKQSAFGELRPQEEELLKPYLFQGGKRIAYITGGSLYNRMGLTTQIPKTIKVASKVKRVTTKIGKTQVKPVKSYVDVTNENYYLLEILDALKDFKTIPDLDKKSAIALLKNKISKLSENDQSKIIRYALKYPPRATALLGAIMELSEKKNGLESLRTNLNPLTNYKLGIKKEILPTAQKWNIN
jgi:predicted transcriptional regulator of viral defense system